MNFFYKLTRSTLVAVYVLILVGGVVRSTGAGMGCPDWPKCFGKWIPPTKAEELPSDYKEKYSEYRHQKNVRFSKYLHSIGLSNTAEQILKDPAIREEADFNPVKTWIEYFNRIVGVIIGFLIFLVFIFSFRYWSQQRQNTILSFFTFILVGFQGWIGSIVVSTNLTPWVITLHMFLALVIVSLLIFIMQRVSNHSEGITLSKSVQILLVMSLLILVVQILLGTQVREAMDRVAAHISNRNDWVDALGIDFIIHRSFSWLVLLVHVLLIVKMWKMGTITHFSLVVILLILGTLITGVGMAWMSVPPFLQPTHLLLATVTFGTEFFLLLKVNSRQETVLNA